MQNTEAAQTRVLALPVEAQAGYLAACLSHVAEAFERVAGIPDDVRDEVLAPSLSALWAAAAGNPVDSSAIASVQTSSDDIAARLGEELSTDLQYLVFSAALAVEGLPGPRATTKQVLNNLDEVVMTCDPDADPGADEEGDWRDDLLSFLEQQGPGAPLSRQSLSTQIEAMMEWERRWSDDYNQ